MNANDSQLRGENGFWGEIGDLFDDSGNIRPKFAPAIELESTGYDLGAKGAKRANSPRSVRGERGEKPSRLSPSPLTSPPPVTVHQAVGRNIVTTLSDITRCDPEVTAFTALVRARFPGCRPLWGRSSLGEIGRQP